MKLLASLAGNVAGNTRPRCQELHIKHISKFQWHLGVLTTRTRQKCFHTFQEISTMINTRKWKYPCFGANPVISSCPSLSQSLADTFTELVAVENPQFVVEISTLPVSDIVPEILIFPTLAAISLFPVVGRYFPTFYSNSPCS